MKLFELTRPERDEARQILLSSGYKQVGDGAYSEVYAKDDSDHVLKLFSSKDAAYLSYLDMVKKNPNPHFPKAKGNPRKITDEYHAVRIEKLTPYIGDEKLLWDIHNYLSIKGSSSNMSSTASLEKKIPADMLKACDLIAALEVPALNRTGRATDWKRKAHYDIKVSNFMMRGSTVVFIDPVH